MTDPAGSASEAGASIEVSFPIARAVRVVKEIDLMSRFTLHEGRKQLRDLFALRDTLADQLESIAKEKGIRT